MAPMCRWRSRPQHQKRTQRWRRPFFSPPSGRVRGSDETIFIASRNIPETNRALDTSKLDEEIAVNTVVANVLKREAEKTRTDVRPFQIIALFCGLGLLASICLMSFGLDVSGGFF
jgi:hypothetical protein